ncbi:MAG: HIT domain-containing protein [Phenylobacterium sp.]|uniref:HIT domain-containing protein n=1 Tax=Phenylobacterium sp. TaxID=1871053 RepID=UPI0027354DAE|nr:HIT domain-containing protein [Phenylobacterium sp.]MDP3176003.1 HIT domain-containing protein [Phenylobacterium sp.]
MTHLPQGWAADPAFEAGSRALGELGLCHARLQDDARYPWVVLIPRRLGARELEDLDAGDRNLLMDEILAAGRAVRALGKAAGRPVEKLNVGALGNVTAQLHVHVVGRRADDATWPGPVWGAGTAQPYAAAALREATAAAATTLGL